MPRTYAQAASQPILSGEIDEYRVLSVDENGVQFGDKLGVVKSLHERVDSLECAMDDLEQWWRDEERAKREEDRTIHQWQIASKAIEAFGFLLLREPGAFSRTSKAVMARYKIIGVENLRFMSLQYKMDKYERWARTHAASVIYNSIPIYYRQMLEQLVRARAAIYAGEVTIISYPPVKKSEILAFLAPYFQQETSPATELLRAVQDVDVIDEASGGLVPMFAEG